MPGYNHFYSIKTKEGYQRVLFVCKRCNTPQYANREKDLPKFCPVCHTCSGWDWVKQ